MPRSRRIAAALHAGLRHRRRGGLCLAAHDVDRRAAGRGAGGGTAPSAFASATEAKAGIPASAARARAAAVRRPARPPGHPRAATWASRRSATALVVALVRPEATSTTRERIGLAQPANDGGDLVVRLQVEELRLSAIGGYSCSARTARRMARSAAVACESRIRAWRASAIGVTSCRVLSEPVRVLQAGDVIRAEGGDLWTARERQAAATSRRRPAPPRSAAARRHPRTGRCAPAAARRRPGREIISSTPRRQTAASSASASCSDRGRHRFRQLVGRGCQLQRLGACEREAEALGQALGEGPSAERQHLRAGDPAMPHQRNVGGATADVDEHRPGIAQLARDRGRWPPRTARRSRPAAAVPAAARPTAAPRGGPSARRR